MTRTFDLVVLGAGPAGEKGGAQAAYFGKSVAIVEREEHPGGAAVHTGTLPSKMLREAALFLSGYRQRELYGITVDVGPDLAVARLVASKESVRRRETARIYHNLERHGIELIKGAARLLDPWTVEVVDGAGPQTLRAEVVLIATGSSPRHPPGIWLEDPDVHDSTTILEIDRLPASLIVLGGGAVGCEFASIFGALGVAVEVVDGRDAFFPSFDREIAAALLEAMRRLGIRFHMGEVPTRVARSDERSLVSVLSDGVELRSEKILVAWGRSGNSAGLGLDEVGVQTDERGNVLVDADFRTAVPSIYAAGDVIGGPALASTAMEQARVAVCHAFGFAYKQHVSSMLPTGVYTIPEVASVGLSEQEAEREGLDVAVGRAFLRDNARGELVGDTDGMVKLLFDRTTRRLVGCHCLGEHASELVHMGEAVILLNGTVDTFVEIVFNYPTISEAYKYASYEALAALDRPAVAPPRTSM